MLSFEKPLATLPTVVEVGKVYDETETMAEAEAKGTVVIAAGSCGIPTRYEKGTTIAGNPEPGDEDVIGFH